MYKKNILLAISLLIIFAGTLTVSFCLYSPEDMLNNNQSVVNSSICLGIADYGSVTKKGPYGNVSSQVRIAYIVGVHPQESNAHNAIVETIINRDSSLKYCYYIYVVNVTKDVEDYSKGRNNGQLLARDYVVPDASRENFDLAVDVHSNVGNWAENTFIFSPVEGGSSESIGRQIVANNSWLKYYVPPNPTSPVYLTIPLINAGVPSVIYETYSKDSYQTIVEHAGEFVNTVDQLENL
jgi:hypothetical protein